MKILFIVLFILGGIILCALLLAVFLKKDYAVEKEITVLKPKEEVYRFVLLLKNQDSYSVWAKIDPAMKKEYRGTDGTVGFVSAWDSENKNAGKGEQEIKKITDGYRIDYELRFIKPFKSTSDAHMITESINATSTKVIWGFSGKMNYPMNLMLLFMDMNKMIGKDFEDGLLNLKTILEKS